MPKTPIKPSSGLVQYIKHEDAHRLIHGLSEAGQYLSEGEHTTDALWAIFTAIHETHNELTRQLNTGVTS